MSFGKKFSGSNRKKRPSVYWKQTKHVKLYLESGQKGFMVTCNFREKECLQETYNILNQFADSLYGSSTLSTKKSNHSIDELAVADNEDNEEEKEAELDISKQLQNEVEALKNIQPSEKRFQAVDTGCDNCLFVKTTLEDPVELALSIINDIAETKIHRTRFLIRLIPVEITCKANLSDIVCAAGTLCDKYFLKEPSTFAIMYNHRYNNSLNRNEIIKELADLIGSKNIGNKADLKNPKLALIVEVIKGMCLMSVVPDYLTLKKYNLIELAEAKSTEKKELADAAAKSTDKNELADSEAKLTDKKELADAEAQLIDKKCLDKPLLIDKKNHAQINTELLQKRILVDVDTQTDVKIIV